MCFSPISIQIPKNSALRYLYPSGYMTVPCGHCLECCQQQTDSWAVRICEEFKKYGTAIFATMTYRDSIQQKDINRALKYKYKSEDVQCIPICQTVIDWTNWQYTLKYVNRTYPSKVCNLLEQDNEVVTELPFTKTVCVEDLQNWIKRFRTRYEREKGVRCPLRYFICQEYGPSTYRPHAHAVLFGISMAEAKDFFKDWQVRYGFCRYEVARSADSCGYYVAKYASKGSFENPKCSHYDYSNQNFFNHLFPFVRSKWGVNVPLCHRPRKLVSQSLGANYLTKEKIMYHLGLTDRPNDLPLSAIPLKFEDLFYENPKYTKIGYGVRWLPRETFKWKQFTSNRYVDTINNRRYYYFSQGAKFDCTQTTFCFEQSSSKTRKVVLPQYYLHRIVPNEVRYILQVDLLDISRKMAEDQYRQLSSDTVLWSDDKVNMQLLETKRLETQERVRKTHSSVKHFYQKSKI